MTESVWIPRTPGINETDGSLGNSDGLEEEKEMRGRRADKQPSERAGEPRRKKDDEPCLPPGVVN